MGVATRESRATQPRADHPLGRHALVALAVLAAGLAATYGLPHHRLFAFGQVVAWFAAAAGLTVLIGLSGQLSLGHAGFMATGAYAMALTQRALYAAGFTAPAPRGSGRFAAAAEPAAAAWTLPVSLLAGVLAALLVGLVLGVAAARLRGPYLAGVTLAFGLIVVPVTAVVDALGGEQGLRVPVPRVPAALAATVGEQRFRVWLALVGAALVLVVALNLVRGRLGRDLRALRDNEVAAALCGVPVARTRVLAFVVSAGAAGLGGGLYAYLAGTVLPGYFGLTTSLLLLVAVVIGGLGSLAGAAWGVLFVVAVPVATSDVMSAVDASPAVAARLAGNLPLALFGLALVVVTLAAPGGIQALLVRASARVRPRRPGAVPAAAPAAGRTGAEAAAGRTGAEAAVRDVPQ